MRTLPCMPWRSIRGTRQLVFDANCFDTVDVQERDVGEAIVRSLPRGVVARQAKNQFGSTEDHGVSMQHVVMRTIRKVQAKCANESSASISRISSGRTVISAMVNSLIR